MNSTIRATGIPWYQAEDYDAIRRIMADGHKLPTSFQIWRTKAERGEEKLRREGHIIVRAFIDPETFPDWCRTRGLNIDAEARILFASLIAKEAHGSSH